MIRSMYLKIFLYCSLLLFRVIVQNDALSELMHLAILFFACNLNLCNDGLHSIEKDLELMVLCVCLYLLLVLHIILILLLIEECFCSQFIYLFSTNIIFYYQDSKRFFFNERKNHLLNI